MGDIITMQDIKNGKKASIKWKYEGSKKDGSTYPLKIWENLECVLEKHGVELRYNQISKEIISNVENSNFMDL